MAIDTLETSEKLVKEGFTDIQAKSLTRLLAEQEKKLATKKDMNDLRLDMNDLKRDMNDLRQEVVKIREELISQFKWMVGLIFLMGGLLGTLITLLKLF